MKKKVIIIGAGPAGLTAAYELLKKSKEYEVIILEETNYIGGISKTVNYKGNRMDIGGHRFFSKDERINSIWTELMPIQGSIPFDYIKTNRSVKVVEKGPNPDKEDNVMLIRNRISRILYSKKFFDYPISLKFDTIKNMGFIKTIISGFSYIKACIFKRKEDSLENFYINRFGYKLYSMFFRDYTYKLWGRHPKEISADWGSQRVKGLSILNILKDIFRKVFHIKSKKVETSLIEEFYYPKYGPGEFYELMADKIISMGGTIIKDSKVTKINYKDDKIISVLCTNKLYKGDIFISSMPLKDLIIEMDITKKVPKDIKRIAKGLPYRDFVTVGLLIDKLKIKNKTKIETINNIPPDTWIYVQEKKVKLLRMQLFNNWSPYMVSDINKYVWLGAEYTCCESDDIWKMSDKELSNFVINELISIDVLYPDSVKDYHCERIKKAYPSYFDTYNEIDKLITYLNKFDNLYCIGRNGQHRYNNMDHSMACGIECINNIINNIKDKSNIWNVNTEKEYHEEK